MKMNKRLILAAILFLAAAGLAGADAVMDLPGHDSVWSGSGTRGFWFQAPVDFVITGLKLPDLNSYGVQNVAIIRFDSAQTPPVYPSSTNAFTTLARYTGQTAGQVIDCDISISEGDVIGILGAAGTITMNHSYGSVSGFTSSIMGFPVTLTRMGMGHNLNSHAAADVWQEPSNVDISRVEIHYYALSTPSMVAEPAFTSGDSNTVFWNAAPEDFVTSYVVQCAGNDAFSPLFDEVSISSPTLSNTFSSLTIDSSYWYRVRSRSGSIYSAWSEPTSSTQVSVSLPVLSSIALEDTDGLNNEDAALYTNSETVKVLLGAAAGGSASALQLSEYADFSIYTESAWTGQSEASFTFTAGDGVRILYGRLTGAGGDGPAVNDAILLDTAAPDTSGGIVPPRNAEISSLDSVSVTFNESVRNVTAALLTVNAQPAVSLSGSGAGPYLFTGFPQPADGSVAVILGAGTVVDRAGNPFAGDSWTYDKDSATPTPTPTPLPPTPTPTPTPTPLPPTPTPTPLPPTPTPTPTPTPLPPTPTPTGTHTPTPTPSPTQTPSGINDWILILSMNRPVEHGDSSNI